MQECIDLRGSEKVCKTMASTSQGTNLSGEPMAARSGAQPKRWGLGVSESDLSACLECAKHDLRRSIALRMQNDRSFIPHSIYVQAKVGVGVLCVALIAAVAIGLGVGLSNRGVDSLVP